MNKFKLILGIETSCDETAAAILKKDEGQITILSNIVASSAKLQEKYGGIIPEQAAREQIKAIIPVITEALKKARVTSDKLDAIAVTQGPGLIGSLLVGVETAKVLSLIWEKPLIPINHLLGHFYANWIATEGDREERSRRTPAAKLLRDEEVRRETELAGPPSVPEFPYLGLLVSGGHTDLVLFKNHNEYDYLGGTRDDAAGECFDKCARLLGFPYPGGPKISKLAENGNPKAFKFPRPMEKSNDFDFSFSGLKTSFANLVNSSEFKVQSKKSISYKLKAKRTHNLVSDLAASLEQAIIDSLITKTIKAAQKYNIKQIIIAGGVAANKKLISELQLAINNELLTIKLFVPPPYLCTDNAAMIASRAFFEKEIKDPISLQADPNLSLA
ncbi:tRNA (adenosine(37)-N6)-threonylcarbamoyltransferase complex transferase subunit TsaD [Candidatus Daviesbacteria bacterium]|nr:tRNA (adenosine(37)-N6)-threonylcarbamoyltransferase complex transferase subunit TsaD [Candidatus Daviesbacteria bacterium]